MSREGTGSAGEAPRTRAGPGLWGESGEGTRASLACGRAAARPAPVRRRAPRAEAAARRDGGPGTTQTGEERGGVPDPCGDEGRAAPVRGRRGRAATRPHPAGSRGDAPGPTAAGTQVRSRSLTARPHTDATADREGSPPDYTASRTHAALRDRVTPTPDSGFEGSSRRVRRRPEPQPQPRLSLLPPSQPARSSEGRGARPETERPRG